MMGNAQIVVGVDGSGTGMQALRWAAAEADRRGAELVIAHASGAGTGPPSTEDRSTGGRESLAAVHEAGTAYQVGTVIAAENPVQLLTRLSEQAELLVVGSQGLSRQSRTLLGDVAFRVAAYARCPVAVVRLGWDEQAQSGKPVVVGIPASPPAADPLHAAFAEARTRGVPIRAVRAWSRVDWTGDLADLVYATSPVLQAKQQDYVDRVLAPLRALFADVPVQTVLSGNRIDEVMQAATVDARLLVLGSRYPDGHSYSRLGVTTSRLIHRMACPTLVVGRAPRPAHGATTPPVRLAG